MNPYLKVVAVALCALIIAIVASRYVQLSSSEALQEYGERYRELSGKHEVTDAERQELERLFREINSSDSIEADLIDFAIKYSTLFLLLVPLTIYSAKRLRLEEGPMFASAGLIFLAFILTGLLVSGAIIASIFFISSAVFQKRRERAGAG